MAQELELKLSLLPNLHGQFTQLDCLRQCPQQQLHLFNAYYDTPDRQLQAARIALRIRRSGEQFIQTLKTSGSSDGGLHDRQEWEWSLDKAELDFKLLQPLLGHLDIDWSQLGPLFSTDFQRTTWLYQQGGSSIELALDSGQVTTPQPFSSAHPIDLISEVELELKQGQGTDLFALAKQLADQLPLRVSRISKAERGYRLLLGAKTPTSEPATTIVQGLSQLQQWMEYADFDPAQAHLAEIADQLDSLSQRLPTDLVAHQTVLQELAQQLKNGSACERLWEPDYCRALLAISAYGYQQALS